MMRIVLFSESCGVDSMSPYPSESGIHFTHFAELLVVMPHLKKIFEGLFMA